MSMIDTLVSGSDADTAYIDETQPFLSAQQSHHGGTSSEMTPFELYPLEISEELNLAFERARTEAKLSSLSEEDKSDVLNAVNRIHDSIYYYISENQKMMVEIKSSVDSAGAQWIKLPKTQWLVNVINFCIQISCLVWRNYHNISSHAGVSGDLDIITAKWNSINHFNYDMKGEIEASYVDYNKRVQKFAKNADHLLECLEADRRQELVALITNNQFRKALKTVLYPWSLGVVVYGAWRSEGLIPLLWSLVVFTFLALGSRVLIWLACICWTKFVILKLKAQIKYFATSLGYFSGKIYRLEEFYKLTHCNFFLCDYRAKFDDSWKQIKETCKSQLDKMETPEGRVILQKLIDDTGSFMLRWAPELLKQLGSINNSVSLLQKALILEDTRTLKKLSSIHMSFRGFSVFIRELNDLQNRLRVAHSVPGYKERSLDEESKRIKGS